MITAWSLSDYSLTTLWPLSYDRLTAQVLREAKEREANVLELRAQEAKIRSQLQFEARKDLPGAIEKLKVISL